MEEAASIPLVGLTAWQVLVETARLKKGQEVLIHAGSGGVGTIAIQLAKHLGAFVATTTRTSNVDWVKALGAGVVIDYKKQDFETVVHDYDVVLNSLGVDVLGKSLQVLKPGGQLISISGPPTPGFANKRALSWPLLDASTADRVQRFSRAYRLSTSARMRASCSRKSGVNAAPKSSASNTGLISTSVPSPIGQRSAQSIASCIESTFHIQ